MKRKSAVRLLDRVSMNALLADMELDVKGGAPITVEALVERTVPVYPVPLASLDLTATTRVPRTAKHVTRMARSVPLAS